MRGTLLAAVLATGAVVGMHMMPVDAQTGSKTPKKSAPPAAKVGASPSPPAAAAPPPPPKPAKELFGRVKEAAPLKARAIGFYSKGCLAGAKPIALDGPAWQAMRLSRNRYWGHPKLVSLIEKLAKDAKAHDNWRGLLVGDMSQPRGGPMLTGHASHQIGLDADIWLTQMPDRRLTEREREDLSATSMLGDDKISVNPKVWTPAHVALIKRAASYPEVERVLVHPAIKKALCDAASADAGSNRTWLTKVRPYWGHHYHMHIRIGCPAGSNTCRPQPPTGDDDGCGRELDEWFRRLTAPPPPPPKVPKKKPPPRKPLTLDQLPSECKIVLESGSLRRTAVPKAKSVPK